MTCPMHILELIIHATIKILLAKESFYRHLLCTMTHVVNRVLLISSLHHPFRFYSEKSELMKHFKLRVLWLPRSRSVGQLVGRLDGSFIW